MLCSSVNTDALVHNAKELCVRSQKKLIAVLKHDAYSCGAAECAAALEGSAYAFACESVEEALRIRAAAPKKRIFVLAPIDKSASFEQQGGIILPADGLDIIDALCDIYIGKREISIRVDVCNSGEGLHPRDFERALAKIESSESLRLYSVFAHAPSLYRGGGEETRREFFELCKKARRLNRRVICHLATSASWQTETLPFDAVRIGTNLFGLPSFSAQDTSFLRPVASLFSKIERIIETSGAVSFYDCEHSVGEGARLGIVSAGYGYLPCLIGKKQIPLLINGKRVKTVGSIYMGHILVDLSEAANAREGDTAILVGKSGGERITAEEFAESCGISVCRCEGALFTTRGAQRIVVSNESCIIGREGAK
ncbi:MAG: hypothetical protein GX683_04280 [Ruminococcaceae bacterium]|nr:hypothetical protein [Oscillospiraceae bacterium]